MNNLETRLKDFGKSILFEPIGTAETKLKEVFPDSKTEFIYQNGLLTLKIDNCTLTIDSSANIKIKKI